MWFARNGGDVTRCDVLCYAALQSAVWRKKKQCDADDGSKKKKKTSDKVPRWGIYPRHGFN